MPQCDPSMNLKQFSSPQSQTISLHIHVARNCACIYFSTFVTTEIKLSRALRMGAKYFISAKVASGASQVCGKWIPDASRRPAAPPPLAPWKFPRLASLRRVSLVPHFSMMIRQRQAPNEMFCCFLADGVPYRRKEAF